MNVGTLRATNSVFRGNMANNFSLGAGVRANNLYLTGTSVVSNTHLGPFGAGSGAVAIEEAIVVDSYFANNRCLVTQTCTGGGLLAFDGQPGGATLVVSGSTFVNNMAPSGGGGIFVNGPTTITNTVFISNSCTQVDCTGGGLGTFGPFTLTQSAFVSNTSAGIGGAVYAWQPVVQHAGGGGNTAELVNNLFADNSAGSDGAAFYFEQGVATLVHNTIASAALNGGQAIYVEGGTVAITNTTVTSHAVGVSIDISGGVVLEDFNLYFGNSVNFSGPVSSGGDSILNGDPDFIDPAAGDYHIGLGSAGLDNAVDLGILVDLDGNPRPVGDGPDRGAYEVDQLPVAIEGLMAENDGPTVVGDMTQLTATITAGNGVSYDWDFGDGSMGSGAMVSHVYLEIGVYTVVVTASNSLNMMTATTMVVVVDEAIVGLAVSSNSPVLLGQPAWLTATVTAGTNVSYVWDFGDGSMGNGVVVSHTYGMTGNFMVTVTATNSVGEMVATAVVVVVEEEMTWYVYVPVALKP